MGNIKTVHRLSEYERQKRANEKYMKYIEKKGVICVETGRLFKNKTETAKYLNCSKTNIGRAIKTGNAAKGYHFIMYSDRHWIKNAPIVVQ